MQTESKANAMKVCRPKSIAMRDYVSIDRVSVVIKRTKSRNAVTLCRQFAARLRSRTSIFFLVRCQLFSERDGLRAGCRQKQQRASKPLRLVSAVSCVASLSSRYLCGFRFGQLVIARGCAIRRSRQQRRRQGGSALPTLLQAISRVLARARQNSIDKAERFRHQRRKNCIDEPEQARLRCDRDFSFTVTTGLDDFARSSFGRDGQRWRSVGDREQGVFFFVLSFK